MSKFRKLKWPDKSVPVRNRVWYDSIQGVIPCVLVGYIKRGAMVMDHEPWVTLRPVGRARSWSETFNSSLKSDFDARIRHVWKDAYMNEYGTRSYGTPWTTRCIE